VKVALLMAAPLKVRLLVVKAPNGRECHHWPVPQSTTLLGFCQLIACLLQSI
jgi:hypothetical protein